MQCYAFILEIFIQNLKTFAQYMKSYNPINAMGCPNIAFFQFRIHF